MAGGVHQIDHMLHAARAAMGEAHGLRLDRDSALALQLHRIEHLAGHFAFLQAAAALDQPVRQRGLPVVDVGDDRDIANPREIGHGRGSTGPPPRASRSQPRSTPPVIFATLATIFAAAASISGSVSVRSLASRRTVIASDFLSASMPGPA